MDDSFYGLKPSIYSKRHSYFLPNQVQSLLFRIIHQKMRTFWRSPSKTDDVIKKKIFQKSSSIGRSTSGNPCYKYSNQMELMGLIKIPTISGWKLLQTRTFHIHLINFFLGFASFWRVPSKTDDFIKDLFLEINVFSSAKVNSIIYVLPKSKRWTLIGLMKDAAITWLMRPQAVLTHSLMYRMRVSQVFKDG